MLGLWVVRYNTGIGPGNHELALVYPSSDSGVHYLFGSRTYHSSLHQLQRTCIYVDKGTLEKMVYKTVFDRDIEALKAAAFQRDDLPCTVRTCTLLTSFSLT